MTGFIYLINPFPILKFALQSHIEYLYFAGIWQHKHSTQ